MASDEKEKFLESVKSDITESVGSTRDEVLSYFIIGVFVGVVVLVIIFLGLEKARQYKISALSAQIKQEVDAPMLTLAKEKTQNDEVIKQLSTLTLALSGQIKYSKLLDDLVAHQYKKSLWTNFALQKDNITITGQTGSYSDVAISVAALRQVKAVKDVKLSSATSDAQSGKVTFTIEITYDASLYRASPKASATPGGADANQAAMGNPIAQTTP